MLFHTWPFLLFLLIVLPIFFALRKTPLWLPWLTASSYVFYAWWNPYYLLIVLYITIFDFLLVALMDRCPEEGKEAVSTAGLMSRTRRTGHICPTWVIAGDPVVRIAFIGFGLVASGILAVFLFGPRPLRPLMGGLGFIVLLMALGALCRSRWLWLAIGVITNLSPLVFFKYARFLAENLNAILSQVHVAARLPVPSDLMPFGLSYLLPIGISFFTFQSLSYIIDCYLGKAPRERSLLRFANFVCFFPNLLAGPIERAGQLLPQFRQFPAIRLQNFTDGLSLFLAGLFKKMALANYLALYVDRIYDNPKGCSSPDLILATFAFGWQLFFDFSGYTDMARGVAKIMGFDLVLNFNHPYLATGLGDFWRRWHISFSRWILDYIFMPLQMYWRDWRFAGTAAALVITFLACGLWHGAAWTFVIWGALHGAGLAATHNLERSAFYRKRVPKLLKQASVFFFVSFTWIFFRAGSLDDALLIVRRIFSTGWRDPQIPALMLVVVILAWLYQGLCESRFREVLKTSAVRVGMAIVIVLSLCFCSSGSGAFIYFQF